MSEQDKQEYMNNLFNRIMSADEDDPIVLPALLGDYESKLAIGWPFAKTDRI